MNTHYIPRLLLRPFAKGEKITTYDFITDSFQVKKLKHTFSEKDLFDCELEKVFATQIEGPMGNLLNNKLLKGNHIEIDRKENMLLRKFLMINELRAPILNETWEGMLERTKLKNHPYAQGRNFLLRHNPEFKEVFDKVTPSKDSYISDLKLAMKFDSLEDILNPKNKAEISTTLENAALRAMVTTIAFWDCEDVGQEFILPKLPGISIMDQISSLHKCLVVKNRRLELEKTALNELFKKEFERLEYGSMIYSDNFSIYPLSPTRVLICFSPYFRLFFSTMDVIPPLLTKEQFDRHFFEPMRMKLFEPCKNIDNQLYDYEVKMLTREEVLLLNTVLLDMETEEFAFHDYNKIRDSFWYYDNKAKLAFPKKHKFSHMG